MGAAVARGAEVCREVSIAGDATEHARFQKYEPSSAPTGRISSTSRGRAAPATPSTRRASGLAVRRAANADGRHRGQRTAPRQDYFSRVSRGDAVTRLRHGLEARRRGRLAPGAFGGLRQFDTACQPAYDEPALGRALAGASRERLWIQTKFTPVGGHDDRKPYHVWQPVEDQVRASFSTSLANLGTTYVDALLLHSPLETYELTLRAWRVLEKFHAAGSVRTLGVSNVAFPTFERLWNESTVKPGIVQNRFYNRTGYDRDLRAFCQHNSVAYQGFWTLTGNRNVVSGPVVAEIASRLGKPPVSVLPGPHAARRRRARRTKSMDYMREDLEVWSSSWTPRTSPR